MKKKGPFSKCHGASQSHMWALGEANFNEWQRARILDEEYAVNRNPSRETVERIVERLSHALDYRQASSF